MEPRAEQEPGINISQGMLGCLLGLLQACPVATSESCDFLCVDDCCCVRCIICPFVFTAWMIAQPIRKAIEWGRDYSHEAEYQSIPAPRDEDRDDDDIELNNIKVRIKEATPPPLYYQQQTLFKKPEPNVKSNPQVLSPTAAEDKSKKINSKTKEKQAIRWVTRFHLPAPAVEDTTPNSVQDNNLSGYTIDITPH